MTDLKYIKLGIFYLSIIDSCKKNTCSMTSIAYKNLSSISTEIMVEFFSC